MVLSDRSCEILAVEADRGRFVEQPEGCALGSVGGLTWLCGVAGTSGFIPLGEAVAVPWLKTEMGPRFQGEDIPVSCCNIGLLKGAFFDPSDENRALQVWLQWSLFPEAVQHSRRGRGPVGEVPISSDLVISTEHSVVLASEIMGLVELDWNWPRPSLRGNIACLPHD